MRTLEASASSGRPNARHVVKTHDFPGAGGQPLLEPGPLAMEPNGLAGKMPRVGPKIDTGKWDLTGKNGDFA